MKRDRYHQPHRRKLLPHYDAVEKVADRFGAFGVALSGAGPTIACFVEREASEWLFRQLEQSFPTMDVRKLSISHNGKQHHHPTTKGPSLIALKRRGTDLILLFLPCDHKTIVFFIDVQAVGRWIRHAHFFPEFLWDVDRSFF